MTKLYVFLFGCVLIVVATAQTAEECPAAAVSEYFKCLDAGKPKEEDIKKQRDADQKKWEETKKQFEEWAKKAEELKPKAEACFTSNNCEKPQGPPGGWNGSKGHFEGHGGWNGSAGHFAGHGGWNGSMGHGMFGKGHFPELTEEMNKTRLCMEAIHERREKKIQECVKAATGLELPQFGQHGGPHGFGGHGGPGGFQHGPKLGGKHERHARHAGFGGKKGNFEEEVMKRLTKQCSGNAAAADAVGKCLNETFKDLKEEVRQKIHDDFKPPALLEQFCSAKNTCMEALNKAGCSETQLHKALQKAFRAKRECYKNETRQAALNKEDPAAGLEQCNGVNLTHGHKGGRFGGSFGGRGGSGGFQHGGPPGRDGSGDFPHGGPRGFGGRDGSGDHVGPRGGAGRGHGGPGSGNDEGSGKVSHRGMGFGHEGFRNHSRSGFGKASASASNESKEGEGNNGFHFPDPCDMFKGQRPEFDEGVWMMKLGELLGGHKGPGGAHGGFPHFDGGRDDGHDGDHEGGRDNGRGSGRDNGHENGHDNGRDSGRHNGHDGGRGSGRDNGHEGGRGSGRDSQRNHH